jgi:SAM-dependent methyltransferase
MNWRAKGAVQKILAGMPLGERVNNLLQVRLGALRNFDGQVSAKVDDWIGTIDLLKTCGAKIADSSLLEIGTGWFPALPVCFWLVGAHNCLTYDLRRYLNSDLTHKMVIALEPHLDTIARAAGVPLETVRERYSKLGTDILRACGITYRAPGDAAHTGLPNQSIDVVFSNSVLEHVTPEDLSAIMYETRRILRPSGVAVHCVACNDHYANFDRGISYVNYLRYSAREWRRWNNSLQYQNRLRAPDFLRIAEDSGLDVVITRQYVRPGVEAALLTLRIAPEFSNYSRAELAATTINFVCRAPG